MPAEKGGKNLSAPMIHYALIEQFIMLQDGSLSAAAGRC